LHAEEEVKMEWLLMVLFQAMTLKASEMAMASVATLSVKTAGGAMAARHVMPGA
jgi:hypothetical protein